MAKRKPGNVVQLRLVPSAGPHYAPQMQTHNLLMDLAREARQGDLLGAIVIPLYGRGRSASKPYTLKLAGLASSSPTLAAGAMSACQKPLGWADQVTAGRNDTMFVNAEDIATFTGQKRPAAMARVLRARRIKFIIDRLTGVPQVAPAVIERYKAREAAKVAQLQERIAEAEEHSRTAAQSCSVLFVSAEQLVELTGKVRPAAQAKWLAASGIRFMRRGDGSVALRLAELDAHTLSAPFAPSPGKAHLLPEPQLQD